MGGRKVDFLTEIRRGRLKKRNREPFQPTLFARISTIVRDYHLTESFLARLGAFRPDLPLNVNHMIPAEKKPLLIPLYALVTEDEYRVTRGILERVANPYLAYAQSPEEIIVSGALFGRNPTLPPDRLGRWDFETLLACELAKEELRELRGEEGAPIPDVIQKRIERLKAFVATLEDE